MKQEALGIGGEGGQGKQTRAGNNYGKTSGKHRREKGVARRGKKDTALVKIPSGKSRVSLSWRWPKQDPWSAFDHPTSSCPAGTILLHHHLFLSKTPIS